MSISKIVSAGDAVSAIGNDDVVASSGWGGHGVAEAILSAIERRYLDTQEPQGLTLVWAGGQGDGSSRGLNHLGHEGLIRRTIGGHYGLVPKLAALAVNERIEAYNLPEGVLLHLYRSIASGAPGLLSTVGLGTFVDPRIEGGKVNRSATEDIVNSRNAATRHGSSTEAFRSTSPSSGVRRLIPKETSPRRSQPRARQARSGRDDALRACARGIANPFSMATGLG